MNTKKQILSYRDKWNIYHKYTFNLNERETRHIFITSKCQFEGYSIAFSSN